MAFSSSSYSTAEAQILTHHTSSGSAGPYSYIQQHLMSLGWVGTLRILIFQCISLWLISSPNLAKKFNTESGCIQLFNDLKTDCRQKTALIVGCSNTSSLSHKVMFRKQTICTQGNKAHCHLSRCYSGAQQCTAILLKESESHKTEL